VTTSTPELPVSSNNQPESNNWKWLSILLGAILAVVLLSTLAVVRTKGGAFSKSDLTGKWVAKETVVPNPGLFDGKGEAMVVERQMTLGRNNVAEYLRSHNARPYLAFSGPWSIEGDYLVLRYETKGQQNMPNVQKFLAGRITRISSERLVIIYEDGAERIFDRVR
jgi:hypothetical protein